MKLWEYVLKYDKKSEYINWLAKENEISPELILKEGYCPGVFDCFDDVKFQYLFDNCKNFKSNNQTKCNKCWDREINNEYELYLTLKEKFEKG
jgi:hypothetical protein